MAFDFNTRTDTIDRVAEEMVAELGLPAERVEDIAKRLEERIAAGGDESVETGEREERTDGGGARAHCGWWR